MTGRTGPEARLTVEVRPRADRDAVTSVEGHTVRVRVAAPPADGAANEAVRALLARALGRPASAVTIVRGQQARTKLVRVSGLDLPSVQARLSRP